MADGNDGLSSIAPPHQWPAAVWSIWVQRCEGEEGRQVRRCHFSWRKFLFSRNSVRLERTWVTPSTISTQSTEIESGPPISFFLWNCQQWPRFLLNAYFKGIGSSFGRACLNTVLQHIDLYSIFRCFSNSVSLLSRWLWDRSQNESTLVQG